MFAFNILFMLLDGDVVPTCDKLLSFTFSGTFDSYSCNNFADGTPRNEPSLELQNEYPVDIQDLEADQE